MTQFNDVVIREDCRTVEVVAGLTWNDFHKYLIPEGLDVVGGRLDGVGVAGLTLGGDECFSSSSSPHSPRKLKRTIRVWQDTLRKETRRTKNFGLLSRCVKTMATDDGVTQMSSVLTRRVDSTTM